MSVGGIPAQPKRVDTANEPQASSSASVTAPTAAQLQGASAQPHSAQSSYVEFQQPTSRSQNPQLESLEQAKENKDRFLGAMRKTRQQPADPPGRGLTESAAEPNGSEFVGGQCLDGAGATSEAASHAAGAHEVTTVNFLLPERIALQGDWQSSALKDAITGVPPKLNLNRVTPEMLKGLSADQARAFMRELGEHEQVKAYVGTADGSRGPAPTSNAAALMAAKMWASGDTAAFAKVFAADPERVMPFLNGRGAGALTAGHLADIVQEMRASGKMIDEREQRVLGSLVQQYLEKNVGEDPNKIGPAMQALVSEISCSGLAASPENAGIVVGTIVAGMLKHFDQIDAGVAQRKEFIGNLAGFASDLGGAAGGWGNALAPVISGLNFIYQNLDQVPNEQEVARRLHGAVQTRWEQGGAPGGWNDQEIGKALRWMGMALRNNGFAD